MLTVQSFVFNPASENTYLVYNEKGNAIIIDPGCYFTEEERTLQSFIDEKKLKVVQLINTHCHLDHIFGNKWVYETYGVELYMHHLDKIILGNAPQSAAQWGLSIDNYKGPLHFIDEGDIVSIDEDKFSLLLTPGHTPGSLSFYCEKQNFVISGDVLFNESIGRTDLPGGDFDTLITSIRTKLFTLPPETLVYNGHGGTTTIGHEIKHNPYLQV
jgi:glyoxylase-like metal-dependent hydrolase (beta-lactamase superfamily II)